MERATSTHETFAAEGEARRLIAFAAAIEALTGLVLISVPSLLGRLILGVELPDVAQGVARLAGIALLAFAVVCWPESSAKNAASAVRGLLLYNLLAVIYFCYWRFTFSAGPLLWPAVALHAILTVLFVRVQLSEKTR